MPTFTESFETERRKHAGATKPKLPVTQSGIAMPRSDNPRTALYGAREQPDHQSGTRIADDIPLRFADFIEDAINLHDELVARVAELEAALKPFADFYHSAEKFVADRAADGGSPILPTKNFRLSDFCRAYDLLAARHEK